MELARRANLVWIVVLSLICFFASNDAAAERAGSNIDNYGFAIDTPIGRAFVKQDGQGQPVVWKVPDDTKNAQEKFRNLQLQPDGSGDQFCGGKVKIRVYANPFPALPFIIATPPAGTIGDFVPPVTALSSALETTFGPRAITTSVVPFWVTVRGCHDMDRPQLVDGFELDIFRGGLPVLKLVPNRALPLWDKFDEDDEVSEAEDIPHATDEAKFAFDAPQIGEAAGQGKGGGAARTSMEELLAPFGYIQHPGDIWVIAWHFKRYIVCDGPKDADELCAVIDWSILEVYRTSPNVMVGPQAGAIITDGPTLRAPNAADNADYAAADGNGKPFVTNGDNLKNK